MDELLCFIKYTKNQITNNAPKISLSFFSTRNATFTRLYIQDSKRQYTYTIYMFTKFIYIYDVYENIAHRKQVLYTYYAFPILYF